MQSNILIYVFYKQSFQHVTAWSFAVHCRHSYTCASIANIQDDHFLRIGTTFLRSYFNCLLIIAMAAFTMWQKIIPCNQHQMKDIWFMSVAYVMFYCLCNKHPTKCFIWKKYIDVLLSLMFTSDKCIRT